MVCAVVLLGLSRIFIREWIRRERIVAERELTAKLLPIAKGVREKHKRSESPEQIVQIALRRSDQWSVCGGVQILNQMFNAHSLEPPYFRALLEDAKRLHMTPSQLIDLLTEFCDPALLSESPFHLTVRELHARHLEIELPDSREDHVSHCDLCTRRVA